MDDVDLTIGLKVSFDPDPERALRDTVHWAALTLTGEEKTASTTRSRCSAGRLRCH